RRRARGAARRGGRRADELAARSAQPRRRRGPRRGRDRTARAPARRGRARRARPRRLRALAAHPGAAHAGVARARCRGPRALLVAFGRSHPGTARAVAPARRSARRASRPPRSAVAPPGIAGPGSRHAGQRPLGPIRLVGLRERSGRRRARARTGSIGATAPVLQAFLESFVLPLFHGGSIPVGRPFRARDLEDMLVDASLLTTPNLEFVRLRRAELLTPHVVLPEPETSEVSLWVGLHNLLVFDHPERP